MQSRPRDQRLGEPLNQRNPTAASAHSIQLCTNPSEGPDCPPRPPTQALPAGCGCVASPRAGAAPLLWLSAPRGSCLSPQAAAPRAGRAAPPSHPGRVAGTGLMDAPHSTLGASSPHGTSAVTREAPHSRRAESHRASEAPGGREKPSPSQGSSCGAAGGGLPCLGGGFPVRVQKA